MRVIDILTSPWAIVPDKLLEIKAIYETHLRGEKIDIKGLEAKLGQPLKREEQGYEVVDRVAIIPVDGVIAKKMNLFSRISGGASTQLIGRDLREALEDPKVDAIILQIDSPGGAVDGTSELADTIYAARGEKPIVAYADGMMASAAYWLGSAADAVYIAGGTTTVGSIGVVATHVDVSRYEERVGIKTTEIYAGRYKRIASSYKPLTDEGRASIQDHVDYIYSVFVGAVAKHRGVSEETVLKDMADGRIFVGQQAIDAGLVDGVSTLDALIADLRAGKRPSGRQTAQAAAHGVTVTLEGGGAPSESTARDLIAAINDEVNLRAGVAPEPSTPEDSEMDMTKLRAEHPALVEALLKEGRDSVDATALRAEGAKAERERIQAIHALSSPGHAKLITEAMFDGTSTAGDVAQKIVAADNAARAHTLDALRKDGADPAKVKPGPANLPPAPDADAHLPLEERCKAKWESDAKVREEFTSYEAYLAYERASAKGKVKILGRKTA